MLWSWGIQVIDFKKLWGSRNRCILCFQGKTIHDNSVTKFTFEFSISHKKLFFNLKYKDTAMYFLMNNNNKSLVSHSLFIFVFLLITFFIIESQWSNICLMALSSNVASLEVNSLAASEPNKPRNFLWLADSNINASLYLVILLVILVILFNTLSSITYLCLLVL